MKQKGKKSNDHPIKCNYEFEEKYSYVILLAIACQEVRQNSIYVLKLNYN